MLIKSFKAPTLKEAMANVKAELGVDAVILHTSKTKKGGILGFHSKEVVEVIAAVEEEPVKPPITSSRTMLANDAVLQAAEAARSSRAAARAGRYEQQPLPERPEEEKPPISAALANFTPRTAVSQYRTAGTQEAVNQAMAQNTMGQSFSEVLASVNQAQELSEVVQSASEKAVNQPENNAAMADSASDFTDNPNEPQEDEGAAGDNAGSDSNSGYANDNDTNTDNDNVNGSNNVIDGNDGSEGSAADSSFVAGIDIADGASGSSSVAESPAADVGGGAVDTPAVAGDAEGNEGNAAIMLQAQEGENSAAAGSGNADDISGADIRDSAAVAAGSGDGADAGDNAAISAENAGGVNEAATAETGAVEADNHAGGSDDKDSGENNESNGNKENSAADGDSTAVAKAGENAAADGANVAGDNNSENGENSNAGDADVQSDNDGGGEHAAGSADSAAAAIDAKADTDKANDNDNANAAAVADGGNGDTASAGDADGSNGAALAAAPHEGSNGTAVPAPAADDGRAVREALEQNKEKDEQINDLQNQLEEMKSMLVEMSKSKGRGDTVPTLQGAMQAQEVTEKILQDMIAKLNGTEILAPKNSFRAVDALERYIRKAVRVANGITLYSNKPKVAALIGPTGVGKTTTLAKIAARFVLEQGARVALITADTYRISAVEQLKTYSDILGLPLEIVYNPDALKKAIEKHKDKQLILIDTAGRSQYNEYQMKELGGLLSIDVDIEKHLVMSATTKTSDGIELLERFSICQPDRVIFSKVDETGTHGIILNILHRRKVALSYITNGQSVPDDIEPASVDRLAELLLR